MDEEKFKRIYQKLGEDKVFRKSVEKKSKKATKEANKQIVKEVKTEQKEKTNLIKKYEKILKRSRDRKSEKRNSKVELFIEELLYGGDFKVKFPYSGVFYRWDYKEFPDLGILEDAVKKYRNSHLFSWDIDPDWAVVIGTRNKSEAINTIIDKYFLIDPDLLEVTIEKYLKTHKKLNFNSIVKYIKERIEPELGYGCNYYFPVDIDNGIDHHVYLSEYLKAFLKYNFDREKAWKVILPNGTEPWFIRKKLSKTNITNFRRLD